MTVLPRFNDIMLDLETQATSDNAVIISIGACRFDIYQGIVGDTFYRNIDPETCLAFGMERDPATMAWWDKQSREARHALLIDQVAIQVACEDFRQWVKGMPKNQRLWANPTNFDCTILRNAFNKCMIPFPIHWTKQRDVRTLVSLGPKKIKKSEPHVGTHHNALDDCRFQVGYVSKYYKLVKHC